LRWSGPAKVILKLALAGAACVALLVGVAWWETRDLPSTANLRAHLWDRFKPKGHSTWVPLWAISPKLQDAVVVWEDPMFYQHRGINFAETSRAFLEDVRAREYRRGGSTITQQVAKNLYLTPEKSLRRKLREAVLAYRLEHALTKDEILEIYLNVAEWGDGIAGAEAASRYYFFKSAEELTWADAALLAAILPSPVRFNPFENPQQALLRRQTVLRKLLENGDIKAGEFRQASATPWRGHSLPFLPVPSAGQLDSTNH
jgi:monofunctional biosynthetic peptidoglycan transglycosylase